MYDQAAIKLILTIKINGRVIAGSLTCVVHYIISCHLWQGRVLR